MFYTLYLFNHSVCKSKARSGWLRDQPERMLHGFTRGFDCDPSGAWGAPAVSDDRFACPADRSGCAACRWPPIQWCCAVIARNHHLRDRAYNRSHPLLM